MFFFNFSNCFGQALEFSERKGCFPLLAGKSSDITASPNQSNNRYDTQHSQNTFSWTLFSWNGTQCPGIVFTQLWNCRETCLCKPENLGLMAKRVFSTSECWRFAASNLPEKHTGSFFSSFQQQFWSHIWVLLKKQSSCHFLLRSHLRVQFQLIRLTTGMALSTPRTLSPDLFSQGILQYILGVSLHNSDMQGNMFPLTCRETYFCES